MIDTNPIRMRPGTAAYSQELIYGARTVRFARKTTREAEEESSRLSCDIVCVVLHDGFGPTQAVERK